MIYDLCIKQRKNNDFCIPINTENTNKSYDYQDIKGNINNSNKKISLKKFSNGDYFNRIKSIVELFNTSRYHTINLENLIEYHKLGESDISRKPTIEIRVKHSSNDPIETYYFCKLIEKIVEKTKDFYNELTKKRDTDILEYIKKRTTKYEDDSNLFQILSELKFNDIDIGYFIQHRDKIVAFNKISNKLNYVPQTTIHIDEDDF